MPPLPEHSIGHHRGIIWHLFGLAMHAYGQGNINGHGVMLRADVKIPLINCSPFTNTLKRSA